MINITMKIIRYLLPLAFVLNVNVVVAQQGNIPNGTVLQNSIDWVGRLPTLGVDSVYSAIVEIDKETHDKNTLDSSLKFEVLDIGVSGGISSGVTRYYEIVVKDYITSTTDNTTGDVTLDKQGLYCNYNKSPLNCTDTSSPNFVKLTSLATGFTRGGALNFDDFRTSPPVGDITAKFIGNSVTKGSPSAGGGGGGAISAYKGDIGKLRGSFIGNHATSTGRVAQGGAIYTHSATIKGISGDFIGNYVTSVGDTFIAGGSGGESGPTKSSGGAIHNENSTIEDTSVSDPVAPDITGNFIGNYAESLQAKDTDTNLPIAFGGAIANLASNKEPANAVIGNIEGDFFANHVEVINGEAKGGAIANIIRDATSEAATIGRIDGSFVGNYAKSTNSIAKGGAIANGNIGIGNTKTASINDIFDGQFAENYALSINSEAKGGAIFSSQNASIGDLIKMGFARNYASGKTSALGGAIYNESLMGDITGNFVTYRVGGFSDNVAISETLARGGAIYNTGTIGIVAAGFEGNYAQTGAGGVSALGGAIYTTNSIDFLSDSTVNIFSENYTTVDSGVTKDYNAIYIGAADKKLTFTSQGIGQFIFNDNIKSSHEYDIDITGGSFTLNNKIFGAGTINVKDATLKLGKYAPTDGTGGFAAGGFAASNNAILALDNSRLDFNNNYLETIVLKSLASINPARSENLDLTLMQDASGAWASDVIQADTITGDYSIVVYPQGGVPDADERIKFMEGNISGVNIISSRVSGSAFLWSTEKNVNGFLFYRGLEVQPEVIAFMSLPTAAIEQTRSITSNIINREYFSEAYKTFNGEILYNTWFSPVASKASIDEPVEMDADILGFEAGIDFQKGNKSKLGAFVSYRQGQYDLSGKSSQYYSNGSSDISIDSYIASLYYEYNKNQYDVIATVFAGTQEGNIKTDDDVSGSADAIQYGASVQGNYTIALKNNYSLTPTFGVFYTRIDYDDAKDNISKGAKYDVLNFAELEAGVKIEKTIEFNESIVKIYVKPSVIQTISGGDNVHIISSDNIAPVSAYNNQTSGRIEIGGEYSIDDRFSVYGSSGYTLGTSYKGGTIALGLSYSW